MVVHHRAITDHEDTCEGNVFGVAHDVNDSFGQSLLWCKLFTYG
jgi:hypothetical protein